MVYYIQLGDLIAPLPELPKVLALGALNLLQAQDDRYYSSSEIASATKEFAKYGNPLSKEEVIRVLESFTPNLETQETEAGLVFKIKNLI